MKTDYFNKAARMGPTLVVFHKTSRGEDRIEFTHRDHKEVSSACAKRWGPGKLIKTMIRGDYYRWESKQ